LLRFGISAAEMIERLALLIAPWLKWK
jgi:hypothetical protein